MKTQQQTTYRIQVHNLQRHTGIDQFLIVRVIRQTLRRFKIKRAAINVALVNDRYMAELHEEFMEQAGPTDVLTFDLADPIEKNIIEGEIIISVDTAKRQSASRGHKLSAELALYAIHGTLHLLGFDDHDPKKSRKMHLLEDEILSTMGVGPIFGNG